MRGSPLMRALVLLCVLCALAWPLRVVTRQAPEAASPAESSSSAEPSATVPVKLPLKLTFARAAQAVEVRYSGKVVWRKDTPAATEALELELPFPKEGLELGVSVRWPEGETAALRLQMTVPDGGELERSVWGSGTVEAVVPFP